MREEFVVIKIKGKAVYLGASNRPCKKDQVLCDWVKSKDDAIWFNTEKEASKFAQSYFKNFNNYEFAEVYCNLGELA